MRIFLGIFVALLVGCSTPSAPFQCASSDPDFCEMEIKAHYEIEKLRLDIERNHRKCRIHGRDSFMCR